MSKLSDSLLGEYYADSDNLADIAYMEALQGWQEEEIKEREEIDALMESVISNTYK